MTDLGLNTSMHANVENEHASAATGASGDGAVHASESGAAYDASGAADATATPNLPDPPGVPDAGLPDAGLPDAPVDIPAGTDVAGNVPDVSGASVDGALGGAGSVTTDGASASWDGMLDGWLDALGELAAQFSGSVTSLFGF